MHAVHKDFSRRIDIPALISRHDPLGFTKACAKRLLGKLFYFASEAN